MRVDAVIRNIAQATNQLYCQRKECEALERRAGELRAALFKALENWTQHKADSYTFAVGPRRFTVSRHSALSMPHTYSLNEHVKDEDVSAVPVDIG